VKEADLGKSHRLKELQQQPTTSKDDEGDEHNIDIPVVVGKFFDTLQKYQHKKLLEDLATQGMAVQEFWQDNDTDYMKFEYGKSLVAKQEHVKLS
jgi:hypothetical protein